MLIGVKNVEAVTPKPVAARVGIGGPVGSGKTALIEALIPELQRRGVDLAVVTNDLVTRRMPSACAARPDRSGTGLGRRSRRLSAHRDPRGSHARHRGRRRSREQFPGVELILFESGGDNLASTFSLDLVDWWMFVIDVAGGDDIPRKKGPGLLQMRSAGGQQGRPGALCRRRSRPHAGRRQPGASQTAGDCQQCALRRREQRRSPMQSLPLSCSGFDTGREAEALLVAEHAGGRTILRRQCTSAIPCMSRGPLSIAAFRPRHTLPAVRFRRTLCRRSAEARSGCGA